MGRSYSVKGGNEELMYFINWKARRTTRKTKMLGGWIRLRWSFERWDGLVWTELMS
jgi:hypothetical protein